MATPSTNNEAPGRRLIVAPTVGQYGPSAGKVLVVWGASALIYTGIVGAALIIFPMLGMGAEAEPPLQAESPTQVVNEDKEYDLTRTDIGNDTDKPLNYNVDRIEEVSVPGQVDPTAVAGIVSAPEGPPMNVPPPNGTGNGQGAASIDPTNGVGVGMDGIKGGYGSSLMVPGSFGSRGGSGSTRQKMLDEGGGNAASEAAVANGLKWLALHQATDGHWSLNRFPRDARTAPLGDPKGAVRPDNCQPMTTRTEDCAGTAFGMLPFLAAGLTHKPATRKKEVDYSVGMQKAINFLLSEQSKASADRGNYARSKDMYAHALATIAMSEVYALTSDPRVKASAQAGLDFVAFAQDPVGGGWGYSPKSAGDTSVTGWQVMALKSGQMAGLNVNRGVLKKAEKFFDSVESTNKGGYKYRPESGESPTMTAVGGLCRQYLGVNPRNPSLLGTVRRLKEMGPATTQDIYYIYYATQVMHHMGGDAWKFWNTGTADGSGKTGIRDTLIGRQHQANGPRPAQAGSFDGNDHVGGRLGGTSLCLLSLEVYYRHLPLYRRDVGVVKPEK